MFLFLRTASIRRYISWCSNTDFQSVVYCTLKLICTDYVCHGSCLRSFLFFWSSASPMSKKVGYYCKYSLIGCCLPESSLSPIMRSWNANLPQIMIATFYIVSRFIDNVYIISDLLGCPRSKNYAPVKSAHCQFSACIANQSPKKLTWKAC